MSNVAALHKGKPTARELLSGIKVIDVDTHVSEPHDLWASRAPARFKHLLPRVETRDGQRAWYIGEGAFLASASATSAVKRDGAKDHGTDFFQREIPDVHPASHDVAARLAMMDECGIHAQIAYPNVLGFGGQGAMKVDHELRLESIRIYNDAMGEMQAQSGDRVFPMALLPWWDIELAVAETKRCLEKGLRGININSDPQDHGLPSLGERHWDPLWDVCVANKLPVNFHIGASDSSTSWYFSSTWPERSDAEKLALGGIMLFIGNLRVMGNILLSKFLERWPDLRIVSVESGAGWIPYLLEAVEYMSRESGLSYAVSPSEVFRRQIYACTFFERRNLVETVRQVGADNVLFETDFPHPACLYPNALEYLAEPLAELTPEERFKIFSGNAAKLYNIPL